MATEKQIAANRANAEHSTGPITDAGKKRASLNALRHGLTAQVCLMPEEDRTAFNQFCAELAASLAPSNFMERQLAHSIAEDNWRLNRARALENNVLALGHYGPEGDLETGHPEIHAAITAAQVYSANPHQFQLLTLYIQRTNRDIHRNFELLRKLQVESKAERSAALTEAADLRQLNQMKRLPDQTNVVSIEIGFVFSTPEIDSAITRRRHLKEAELAKRLDFDRRRYRNAGGSLAA
jgi:hypothetical protein